MDDVIAVSRLERLVEKAVDKVLKKRPAEEITGSRERDAEDERRHEAPVDRDRDWCRDKDCERRD